MLGNIKSASLRISAWVLAFAVGSATVAFAQEYGTRKSPTHQPTAAIARSAADAAIPPFRAFGNANYGTGGVALRNRGAGSISVSGVTGAVQAAYLYWAVIDPNSASASIFINRRFPLPLTGPGIVLTGTVVGTGAQPCWIGNNIVIYRAAIPLYIVSPGNGEYAVSLLPGAAGSTDGGDPWVETPVLPLWEGASIVMIGTGGGTVNLFDGLPADEFSPPFSYSLTLTGTTSETVLWDNIGADGQVGGTPTGRSAEARTSGETTTINGLLIAGPGSALNLTGDWNGSSGFPLPQLWDDTGHQFPSSGASTLNITIDGGPPAQDDCLVLVANVVQF